MPSLQGFLCLRPRARETWSFLTCFCQAVWYNPERRNQYDHEKLRLYCLLNYEVFRSLALSISFSRRETRSLRSERLQRSEHQPSFPLCHSACSEVCQGPPPSLFPLGGHLVLFLQQLPWFLGADLVHSLFQFSVAFVFCCISTSLKGPARPVSPRNTWSGSSGVGHLGTAKGQVHVISQLSQGMGKSWSGP